MAADTQSGKDANLAKGFVLLLDVLSYRQEHLSYLQTPIDYGIVLNIGHEQSLGKPMTMTHIFMLELGPSATVTRRLSRLLKLEVVCKAQTASDKRVVFYSLTNPHMDALIAFSEFLKKAQDNQPSA